MSRRIIGDAVFDLAAYLTQGCHAQVAQQYAQELARYARLTTACDALESFSGYRPKDDEDAFRIMATRRTQIADLIAHANLQAFEQEAPAGLYLAIPYFLRCTDKQPIWLLNRTEQRVTYLRRDLNAYASSDEGIDHYQASGNAFADGIAASALVEPGGKLQIDEYSMSFDGDFVNSRRVVLLIDGVRSEWFVSISKLAGYLWDEQLHGLHRLEKVGEL